MADPTGADFAYQPPAQSNAYGPPLGMPRVVKPMTPTSRQIEPGEGSETSVGTGISRRNVE